MTGPQSRAFARPASEDDRARPAQAGLSKLEYFAAAALSGLLASDREGFLTAERAASLAITQARALTAALEAEEA